MADQKISELTALTGANVADDDAIAIVDTSATETKKIVFSELKNALDTATGFVRITGDTMTGALDVQSTITADGLTVDGAATITGNTSPASDEVLLNLASLNGTGTAGNMLRFTDTDPTAINNGSIGKVQFYSEDTDAVVVEIEGQNADASPDGRLLFKTAEGTTLRSRMVIDNNGDISFYEDTGTTPKFFWDASAESLGIGTTSPATSIQVVESGGTPEIRLADGTNAAGLGVDTIPFVGAISNTHFAIKTNNTERMRIDSSGRVGIGESNPDTSLDVVGGSADSVVDTLTLKNDSTGISAGVGLNFVIDGVNDVITSAIYGQRTGAAYHQGSLQFLTNDSAGGGLLERMRIDSSGNVGIGTSSPSGASGKTLAINGGSGQTRLALKNTSTGDASGDGFQISIGTDGSVGIEQRENNYMAFYTNTSERMRIDSAGNLLVGTTSWSSGSNGISIGSNSNSRLLITNSIDFGLELYGATSNRVSFYAANGAVSRVGSITVTNGSTSYNTSSDYRLKTDAQPMTGASARVQALNPVNFEWLSDGTRVDGFLAHEAQAVVPEAVTGTKDAVDADGNPDYQGIDQSKLVPLLTAALQEALTKIDALETRITALEG